MRAAVQADARVLVVDDTESQRYGIARTLRAAGYDVVEAETGESALELAEAQQFDAVVLDVHLPGLDGFEVCRRLKRADALLPLLILSSVAVSADDYDTGLGAGAEAYLQHPFDPSHLCALVGALIRSRRAARAAVEQIRANSLLQDALDALVDHVALLDQSGEIVAVNRAWLEFGRENGIADPAAGLGRNYLEVCERDPGDAVAHHIARSMRDVLAGRIPAFEATYPCHSPTEERWFSVSVRAMHRAAIDNVAAIVLHTERTAAVQRQRAELRFRTYVEASKKIIWAIDGEGRTTYVSPRITMLAGYAPESLVGLSLDGLLVPDGFEIRDLHTAAGMVDHFEGKLRTASGEEIDVTVALSAIDGELDGTRLIAIVADNRERKTAERQLIAAVNALRLTEQRLRDQFDKLPVPTFLYEAAAGGDFLLVDANHAADAILESVGERVGARASALMPAEWGMLREFARALRDNTVVQRRNLRYRRPPSSDERTFDLTIGPQLPDRILVHAVETTEQTRLANELRQAQKMEAVGQLAGGVAHDFNNLLTVIGAHCTFLLEHLPAASPGRGDAEAIQDAADRAASLTRQLLAFSRKQLLAPTTIDLNAVVEGAHRLLRRLLGEDVIVHLDLAPPAQYVHADPGQLEQVLMNLVVNARDAMPGGGLLTISSRTVIVHATSGHPRFIAPGDYVCLRVADTGVGISAEVQARIFEPFFTTKAPGRGTGLGLSTAYGIIKQSGGYLTVTSAPGAGAAFDIYLPRQDAPRPEEPRPAVERPAPAREATILLVEDDDAVRRILRRTLDFERYRVIEAVHGAAAIDAARALDGPLDLIISDAVMPGLCGTEVIRQVCELHPGARAILISGYTDDEMARRGIQHATDAFLHKPFPPSDLLRCVRQVLEH